MLSLAAILIAMTCMLLMVVLWTSKVRPWPTAALSLALIGLSLWSLACDIWQPDGPTIVITNTNTAGNPGTASPNPGTPASCPLPQSVSLGGCGNGVRIGESCDLSLTPFLAPGVPSPAACDDVRKVEWISTTPGVVLTAGSNPYTPSFKGVSLGVAKVYALVDNVKSATIDVEVRP